MYSLKPLWILLAIGALLPAPVWAQSTSFIGSCLTGRCHSDLATAKFIHGPIGGGICPICHNSGEAPRKALPPVHPAVRIESAARACLLCHEEIRALLELDSIHSPVEDGYCIDCHDPHQSDSPYFLKFPPKITKGWKIMAPVCNACHEPGDPEWFNAFHAGEAILDCIVCHNAHASAEKFQLTGYVRKIYLLAMLEEATEHRQHGNLGAAARAYRKAQAVDSNNTETSLSLGEIYLAQEDWAKAEREFENILSRHPDHAEALLGAAAVAEHFSGASAALEYLKKARDHDPNRADIHDRLGLIYFEQGQNQEALSEFSRAIEADGDYAPAHLHLSQVLDAMGKTMEARKELEIHHRLTGK